MVCEKSRQAAFPVSQSAVPLFFDTLSAQKLEYVFGGAVHIYSYIKCYALGSSLSLALYAFEKEPGEGSVFTLLIKGGGSLYLRLEADGSGAVLSLCGGEDMPCGKGLPLEAFEASSFKGEDEQGFYWGANVLIDKESLERAGITAEAGSSFRLAAFKYQRENPSAYCSNFKPQTDGSFTEKDFPLFTVVDY